MTRGTPEGARDFLVPVRLQPGRFFALAQSPQIFKQLCMIGGLDRYYQIATCWRDEDLRADRQFEFRQLDLELAFVERENVLDVLEQVVVDAFAALEREPLRRGRSRDSPTRTRSPRYGTDKPDLRFGLEIQDATEVTRGSEFGVFGGADDRALPRRAARASRETELQRLEEIAKEWGAKGLAYLVYDGDEVRSPIAKFLSERELDAFRSEPGSTVLFAAGDEATVARVLGGMRIHLGRELELASEEELFHWMIDFPLFEIDDGLGQLDVPAPSLHGADRGPRGAGRERSRKRAEPALRPHLERVGARLRLDPDPPPGRAARRLPDDGDDATRRRARSSLSSSTRWRWARRRTAASRWGSSVSSRSWRASRTSARSSPSRRCRADRTR